MESTGPRLPGKNAFSVSICLGLLVCDEENRILSCVKDHDDSREPPRADEWEPAFEACFYRDIWQLRGREGELYSPKRTFDLCLFFGRVDYDN